MIWRGKFNFISFCTRKCKSNFHFLVDVLSILRPEPSVQNNIGIVRKDSQGSLRPCNPLISRLYAVASIGKTLFFSIYFFLVQFLYFFLIFHFICRIDICSLLFSTTSLRTEQSLGRSNQKCFFFFSLRFSWKQFAFISVVSYNRIIINRCASQSVIFKYM